MKRHMFRYVTWSIWSCVAAEDSRPAAQRSAAVPGGARAAQRGPHQPRQGATTRLPSPAHAPPVHARTARPPGPARRRLTSSPPPKPVASINKLISVTFKAYAFHFNLYVMNDILSLLSGEYMLYLFCSQTVKQI